MMGGTYLYTSVPICIIIYIHQYSTVYPPDCGGVYI
jgi:hypothetical protein